MQRLRALDAMRPQIPIPKGPMPTSAKQARAAMRGPPARTLTTPDGWHNPASSPHRILVMGFGVGDGHG